MPETSLQHKGREKKREKGEKGGKYCLMAVIIFSEVITYSLLSSDAICSYLIWQESMQGVIRLISEHEKSHAIFKP